MSGSNISDSIPPFDAAFVTARLNNYTHNNLADHNLWESFTEDFIPYKDELLDTLETIDKGALRSLRNRLITKGVWVSINREVSIAQALFDVIVQDAPPEWTVEEVSDYTRLRGRFDSPAIEQLLEEALAEAKREQESSKSGVISTLRA